MELALALLLGLIIGSFLNVCIYRIPEGRSIVRPRSECPRCRKRIAWFENVPILSYIALKGRCRRCRGAISPRYPIVEASTALVSVLLYFRFGLGPEWLIFFAFCGAMIVLAFIDVDHRILPDSITLNGIWIGALSSVLLARPSPFAARALQWIGADATEPRALALAGSLLGIAVGGGLLWAVGEAYLRLRGVEGMGFGDVKMMAMVGAFLGAPLALFTIMVGSLLGSIVGLAFIRLAGKSRNYELPFGTFLSFAAIVAVLYGDAMIQLYMDLLVEPAW